MNTPAELVQRIEAVGTVPASVAQIFSLIGDARATAADFERVVRPDLGLTANLLKCANSVYFHATREVTSVKDAVNRMGLRRVFEIAASSSFASAIPARLAGYRLTATEYWAHGVAVAVLSDRVGREAGFTYPDLAFTAGLLHDLGKVVVASFLSPAPTDAPALKTVERERETLGTDHAELGEQLATRWNLPKEICGAARWHHAPAQAPTATLRYLSTVVQVADAAAHLSTKDTPQEGQAFDPESLERLSLTEEKLARLAVEAAPEVQKTVDMLRGLTIRQAA